MGQLGYNLFLIGFMGSGKSTLAAHLGKRFGMEIIEMDQWISKREGMSISEIFDKHGEEYFRNLETNLLKEAQEKKNTVVSCGGGVPMREENVIEMKKSGKVVLLKASPEMIYERVKDNHDRPLLENNKSVSYIAHLMEQRREKYEAAADIALLTDGKTIAKIGDELIEKLMPADSQKERQI